jgi:hypothetical protein
MTIVMNPTPAALRAVSHGGRKAVIILDAEGRAFVRPSGALAWWLSQGNAREAVTGRRGWRAVELTPAEVAAGLDGALVAPPAATATPAAAPAAKAQEARPAAPPAAAAPVAARAAAAVGAVAFVTPPAARPVVAPAPAPAAEPRIAVVHFWGDGTIRSPQGDIVGDARRPAPSPEHTFTRGFWVKPRA